MPEDPAPKTPAPSTSSKATVRRASLKSLGEHLGLSPSTVSFVLNNTPGRAIPESTRARVREAAAEMNYQPSIIARTLRGQPMRTVGILLPELGEGYHARLMHGIGDLLMERDYFYFIVQHRHRQDLIEAYPRLLESRGVDGILAIDTRLSHGSALPMVLIAGHTELPEVSNVVLHHEHGARLALEHLRALGHRHIVFMKGQSVSTDTELRWEATVRVARELAIPVLPDLTVELMVDSDSPEVSYPPIHDLLSRTRDFSAVLAFNDVSAMGTIRALHDAGLRVPEDISVLGYDDIQSASFHVPSLTTIRQPLQRMGRTAAETLLGKLAGEAVAAQLVIEPELMVRESTGPARRRQPGTSTTP